jgi:hypothetical protein
MFSALWFAWQKSASRRRPRSHATSRRLYLEPLEDRTLLSAGPSGGLVPLSGSPNGSGSQPVVVPSQGGGGPGTSGGQGTSGGTGSGGPGYPLPPTTGPASPAPGTLGQSSPTIVMVPLTGTPGGSGPTLAVVPVVTGGGPTSVPQTSGG